MATFLYPQSVTISSDNVTDGGSIFVAGVLFAAMLLMCVTDASSHLCYIFTNCIFPCIAGFSSSVVRQIFFNGSNLHSSGRWDSWLQWKQSAWCGFNA